MIKENVTIITGAAGGIGQAIALKLHQAGHRLVLVDNDTEKLKMVEIPNSLKLNINVGCTDQVEQGVRETIEQYGVITGLVHAAGILHHGGIFDLSEQQWYESLNINVGGIIRFSKAVCCHMIKNKQGSIVTVASNSAFIPRIGMTGYSTSKSAAIMLTKNIGLELAKFGIRCNVVAPGSTATDMLYSLWNDDSDENKTLFGDLSSFRTGIPMGKIAQPTNIADAVSFLLNDSSSHITLSTITVDGGASLGVG